MTIIGNVRGACVYSGWIKDDEILILWKSGMDTLDIARTVGVAESAIAGRLPKILENLRRAQEWNVDDFIRFNAAKP